MALASHKKSQLQEAGIFLVAWLSYKRLEFSWLSGSPTGYWYTLGCLAPLQDVSIVLVAWPNYKMLVHSWLFGSATRYCYILCCLAWLQDTGISLVAWASCKRLASIGWSPSWCLLLDVTFGISVLLQLSFNGSSI